MKYIYCYTNKVNGKKYVGQTNNIQRRQNEHKSVSFNEKDNSYNYLFHKKIREYGLDNFEFEVLEKVKNEETDAREQYWIEQKQSYVKYGKGYNLTFGGTQSTNESKISYEQALEIQKEIKQGTAYSQIQKKYDVCASYVSNINSGLYFRNEDEAYPLYKYYKTDEDYSELIDLLVNSDLTLREISEKLKIGYSTVKKINQGTLRKGMYPHYPIRDKSGAERKSDKIKILLSENKKDVEILSEVKTSRETIRRINLGITHHDEELSYPLRNL